MLPYRLFAYFIFLIIGIFIFKGWDIFVFLVGAAIYFSITEVYIKNLLKSSGTDKPKSLGNMNGEAIRNAFNILNKLEDSGFCVYQDALVSLSSYKGLLTSGFDRYEPFLIFVFNSNRVENGLVGYFECKDWVEFLYGKVSKYESYAVYSNESYSLKLIDSLMIVKLESCFVQTSSFGVLVGFPCKFYDEAKKLYCYNKAKEMFSTIESKA